MGTLPLTSNLKQGDRLHLTDALQRLISASLASGNLATESLIDQLFPAVPPSPKPSSSPSNDRDGAAWHLKSGPNR